MGQLFGEEERLIRKVRKAGNETDYLNAVHNLFVSSEMNGSYHG